MTDRSRAATLACTLALAGLAAACSTPSAPPAAQATARAPAKDEVEDKRETITGSRIPSKTTDRLVKRTDAAGAREMDRERGPDPGPMRY